MFHLWLGGRVRVSGNQFAEVMLRNNFLNRFYRKSVAWADASPPGQIASPPRLHGLAPLCSGSGCTEPDGPSLFTGRENFASWKGWSKVLFNVIRNGSAINASGRMSYTVIAGNVFAMGGIQEGITELPFGAEHVLIYHNWSLDGLGSGINILGSAKDVVLADNQLRRSPGDFHAGAGTDHSAVSCNLPHRDCRRGTGWSIILQTGNNVCRGVTLENNLSAGSNGGGIAVYGCERLRIRNNTVAGARRAGVVFAATRRPGGPAQIHCNIVSHEQSAEEPSVIHLKRGPFSFEVGDYGGNFFQDCDPAGAGCPRDGFLPLVTTDAGWTDPPVYADAERDDFHIIGGWSGSADRCSSTGGSRYPRPGFTYADELDGDLGNAELE